MRPVLLFLLGVMFVGSSLMVSSCQKDTDCKVSVICLDSTGARFANAQVYLYAPVKSKDGKTTYTADVTATGYTDNDGTVLFNFKLPAIYDIKATGTLGGHSVVGTSVVKLEEGKTVQKDVTLR